MGARRRRSRQSDPPRERNRKVDSHCECRNRMPAPNTPTKMALSRPTGPTDDFVPLASVLEDYTESSEAIDASSSKKAKSLPKGKKTCCVHANPCVLASRSCAKSPLRGDGFIQRRSKDNSCDYYLKNSAKSPTVSEAAFEKLRHDQKSTMQGSYGVKTRWPLTELISELLMNPPSSSENSVRAMSNHPKKAESSSSGSNFYDTIANHGAHEPNCTSSGRRKSTKPLVKHAYPKLKGVLEETGYIELRVPSTGSPHNERSPRSVKKNTVWDNLPYADVGYLRNRSITTPPTSSGLSTGASSPPEVPSEKEFINRASDLELVCRYYIGHKERKAAETAGKFTPDSFFLYHQVPELHFNLDNLKKCIRLFLLYVTPTLRFKHYAIQKFWKDPPVYCVEADPKRTFKSLNELIRYYALNKTVVGRSGQKQRFPGS